MLTLWKYTKKGKKVIIPGLILMIAGSMLFAAIPMVARGYIDDLSKTAAGFNLSGSELYYAIAGMIGMVLAWFVLYTLGKTIVVNDVSGKKLRDEIAEKTNRISVASIEDHQTGDVAAIMANDVPQVTGAMFEAIPNFFVQLALLLFIILMMFLLDIYLATVYFVLLVVSYMVTRRIGDRMHREMWNKQESMGRLNGYFNDAITSHSLVKIYGLEDKVIDNFDRIDEEHKGTYVRTTSMFGFVEPVSRIIDNIGYFVTAVMGSIMIIEGSTTFGTFLAFISYAAIVGRPLVSFTSSINKIQVAMVSYDRILDYLDEPEMPNESAFEDFDTDEVSGSISFRDVSFTYPDGTAALKDVAFEIEPGSMVSIIGEEGSGKSTVSDLIMGFRMSTEGQVLLDGMDVADLKRSRLRSVIGISSQDPFVFEGTVYYNLSRVAPEEEIIRVSKLTGFDECVRKLPKGYDTVIGGRGHGLSSGEKQLLSITRLLLYDPKVMIFDESSSDMDPLTNLAVIASVRDYLKKNKTLIIIDNTSLSVQNADKVIFMGKGRVLDMGTHSELMDRNPAYVEMYRNMLA